jgi:hypothetical protein
VDIAPAGQTAAEAMWASYVADSSYDGPLVTGFASGDSAELADELGLLVRHGPKRATAELVRRSRRKTSRCPGRATGASCPVAMAGRWRSCARRTCEPARSGRPATASRGTKARVTGRGPGSWTRTGASSAVSARRWA